MIVLVVCVAGGMFAWLMMLNNHKQELTEQVTLMEQKMAEVKAIEAQAIAEEAKAPIMQGKVTFFDALAAYNVEYPKLYAELAKYTYSRVLYRSVEPSGTQLKIGATARSVGDCGRYLLNMYRATHIFNSVTIDAVPGWGGAITQGFDFSVTCNLVKPINAPTYGAAAGAAGTPPGGPPAGPAAPQMGPPPTGGPPPG